MFLVEASFPENLHGLLELLHFGGCYSFSFVLRCRYIGLVQKAVFLLFGLTESR